MGPIYYVRRPLHKISPQVSEVLHDPAAVLSRQQLVIRDRLLGAVVCLFGGLALTYVFPNPGAQVLFARYLLVGLLLLLPLILTVWRRQVVIDAEGFEYAYGRKSVFIPWSVFDVSAPCIAVLNSVKLPIISSAIRAIEHRRDGIAIDYGLGRSSLWVKITPDGIVSIEAPVSVEPKELGDLVLHLARVLPAGARLLSGHARGCAS